MNEDLEGWTMDSLTEMQQRIRETISRHFPLAEQQQIADDASLLESGIVDSMGILEIVTLLEEEHQITIDDEDLTPENFDSIDTLSRFVLSRQQTPRPSSGANS